MLLGLFCLGGFGRIGEVLSSGGNGIIMRRVEILDNLCKADFGE
jgi:hypothetical protein